MTKNATYVCGAGVTHHERDWKVEQWRKADQERLSREAAAKVRAHDDYMEGMRLFRERAQEVRSIGQFTAGYHQAIRDMDRALVHAMQMRQDEEMTQ